MIHKVKSENCEKTKQIRKNEKSQNQEHVAKWSSESDYERFWNETKKVKNEVYFL